MGSPSTAGRVLVVEDNAELRSFLVEALTRAGFSAREAGDAATARASVREGRFDLVVLDLNLPDADGLDLLAQIRDFTDVPAIIVSAQATETDRIVGIDAGADDYLTKPVSARELVSRARAVLRRTRPNEPTVLRYGELEIDPRTREIRVRGEVVETTRKEFDLLAVLATHPRTVFSRRELLEVVWGSAPEYQTDATVTEHVRRLRQKLEADPERPRWIVTVRGVGYRFEP